MVIPEDVLDRLRARGLLIGAPFVSGHVAYPDGVEVAKPDTVAGNSLPGYRCGWGMTRVNLDAPGVVLHRAGARWVVSSEDHEPGPGPGDFVHRWDTADQAVADIVDFFFGDPRRMAAKR